MNKRAARNLVILTIVLVLLTGIFASCLKDDKSDVLAAPILTYDSATNVVSWEHVDYSDSYRVNEGGENNTVTTNKYSPTSLGTFDVSVVALPRPNSKYKESPPSTVTVTRTLQLAAPTARIIALKDGHLLIVDEVPDAAYYEADGEKMDGNVLFLSALTTNKISVKAIAGDSYHSDSEPTPVPAYAYRERHITAPVSYDKAGESDLTISTDASDLTAVVAYYGDSCVNLPYMAESGKISVSYSVMNGLDIKNLSLIAVYNDTGEYIDTVVTDSRKPAFAQDFFSSAINEDVSVVINSYNGSLKSLSLNGETLSKNYYSVNTVIPKTFISINKEAIIKKLPDNAVPPVEMSIGAVLDTDSGEQTINSVIALVNGNSPELTDNEIYYKYGSNAPLAIRLNLNGAKIVSVNSAGLRDMYAVEDNVITFSENYLSQFSVGANITVKVDLSHSVINTFTFDIIIRTKIPTVIGDAETGDIIYDRDTRNDLLIKTIQGNLAKTVLIDGNTVTFTGNSNQIKIGAGTLSLLSLGRHTLTVVNDYGYVSADLIVIGENTAPQNVRVDDSGQLGIIIRWDNLSRDAVEEYKVKIGNKFFSSLDKPQLFDGDSFNADGLIKDGDKVEVIAVYAEFTKSGNTVEFNKKPSAAYYYIAKQKEYLGENFNLYVESERQLHLITHYMLLYNFDRERVPLTEWNIAGQNEYPTLELYIAYGNNITVKTLEKSIKSAISIYPEAVKHSMITQMENNILSLGLKTVSVPTPTTEYTEITRVETNEQEGHYTKTPRAADYEDFAINKEGYKSVAVSGSDELYFALERGLRPLPIKGSTADRLYNKAKAANRIIISDDMNDYQKVHAIYDWIIQNTVYDHAVVKEMGDLPSSSALYDKFYSRNSFFLEGVFDDGVAVCNGFAKAMAVMCALEGIPCVKVTGKAPAGAHAWNKVYIGGTWYLCDTTWGTISNGKTEYISHQYLLVSDSDVPHKQEEQFERYVTADKHYDVFANDIFEWDADGDGIAEIYDRRVNSKDEADALIQYLTSPNVKARNVSFAGFDAEVRAALERYKNARGYSYRKVSLPGSSITEYLYYIEW